MRALPNSRAQGQRHRESRGMAVKLPLDPHWRSRRLGLASGGRMRQTRPLPEQKSHAAAAAPSRMPVLIVACIVRVILPPSHLHRLLSLHLSCLAVRYMLRPAAFKKRQERRRCCVGRAGRRVSSSKVALASQSNGQCRHNAEGQVNKGAGGPERPSGKRQVSRGQECGMAQAQRGFLYSCGCGAAGKT